jgi:hypothetical protein
LARLGSILSSPLPRVVFLALLALLAAALTAGCGDLKTPTEPVSDGPGTTPRFSQLQREIFTPSCAKSGCHVDSFAAGGLVLEAGRSHAELVGRRATSDASFLRVAPGDPARSYILKKLRGDADIVGTRMPQDGPPFLSAATIAGIEAWIRAGAFDD